jgi:hypothetical protein
MSFDPQRLYSVIEDSDGLHVVPMYRIITGGNTLLCSFSLISCGVFVAAYLTEISAGKDAHDAREIAMSRIPDEVRRKAALAH